MKFQLNLTNKTLFKGEHFSPVSEEYQFTTQFGGFGWWLEEQNHWITFTVGKKKIVAFYKQPDGNHCFYYRKELPRSELVEVEFTLQDRVIKNEEGRWVKVNSTAN